MNKRVARFLVEHHKLVLIAFTIITAALGYQALNFKIDASADTLLTKGNKLYLQTQVVNERFSPQEFLLIAYQPKDHKVLSQKTFNNIAKLSAQLEQIERVESVRSILNVPLLSLAKGGLSADSGAKKWTIEQSNFSPSVLKEVFTDHPIFEDLVINKAQTATALQVLFKPNKQLSDIDSKITALQEKALEHELSDNDQETLQTLQTKAAPLLRTLTQQRNQEIAKIRELIKPYEAESKIYLGGAHVLGYQLINIIKNDLSIFGGAIAGMICLVLFVIFGKTRWVLIPVLCCLSSVICTVGLFGLLGFKATVISSNFIALQLILTLAIVVHLIVQYREYSNANPEWQQKQLVIETFARKVQPCFYAGITTSIGFASLVFTDIQPVISFGWMMIIAMTLSISVSLLLFPATLSLLKREQPGKRSRWANKLLQANASWIQKHPRWPILTSLMVLAIGCSGLFFLSVENSFINYFRDSTKVHQELSFIDQEFGGSTPLQLVYTLPEKPANTDLEFTARDIQTLQLIQAALERHKGVGDTLSVVNFTQLAQQINDAKPLTEYELNAVYWSMDESLKNDLLGSYFNKEERQVRISTRIQDTTEGLNRADLLAGIHADMEKLAIPQDRYQLTDLFVLYQNILDKLFRSQILALGIVYVLLLLSFWALFRSFKIALIGITPNILTTIAVLGFMGWMAIPLDLMTITIASIAMGIAVDDTIHYIHRYREELTNGDSAHALERTHMSVGYALLYTTTIITLGFLLLVFSDFVPSVQFGLLTSLAMLIALLSDLTLLPVLLKRFIESA
ncbi:efflux RND transporter permease subunit [Gilvimarinus polysaccharolyticus]|uniref:efflux RND transporter permease subunit n=1 Tax=Gilvimarinus polysaccharolyticus TaxID=863921 RepID=UPI00067367A8|nr:efflux RND transporter permease subunit [Gilvimarinus polysaccharolyticus]